MGKIGEYTSLKEMVLRYKHFDFKQNWKVFEILKQNNAWNWETLTTKKFLSLQNVPGMDSNTFEGLSKIRRDHYHLKIYEHYQRTGELKLWW